MFVRLTLIDWCLNASFILLLPMLVQYAICAMEIQYCDTSILNNLLAHYAILAMDVNNYDTSRLIKHFIIRKIKSIWWKTWCGGEAITPLLLPKENIKKNIHMPKIPSQNKHVTKRKGKQMWKWGALQVQKISMMEEAQGRWRMMKPRWWHRMGMIWSSLIRNKKKIHLFPHSIPQGHDGGSWRLMTMGIYICAYDGYVWAWKIYDCMGVGVMFIRDDNWYAWMQKA